MEKERNQKYTFQIEDNNGECNFRLKKQFFGDTTEHKSHVGGKIAIG